MVVGTQRAVILAIAECLFALFVRMKEPRQILPKQC